MSLFKQSEDLRDFCPAIPSRPTAPLPRQIEILALKNATVAFGMQMYLQGGRSVEECLCAIISTLVDQNEKLFTELSRSMPSPIIREVIE